MLKIYSVQTRLSPYSLTEQGGKLSSFLQRTPLENMKTFLSQLFVNCTASGGKDKREAAFLIISPSNNPNECLVSVAWSCPDQTSR